MKKLFNIAIALLTVTVTTDQEFRAPAYPLITHDPYFSINRNAFNR